ncbi:MAG: c-type cytochrome [Planctomycetes bacterium]|nr:c-type cytochrome [Planctomycetota bacterium]
MRRLLNAAIALFWLIAGGLSLVTRKRAAGGRPAGNQATRGGRPAEAGHYERHEEPRPGKWGLRRIALVVAAVLAVQAVGGFLVVVTGVAPIKASSGHWPITAWFLNFSMSRSVSTHSIGIKAPPLDEPHLVVKGAAHYATGCFPCHGSPQLRHPRIARGMTPHPPYLPPAIPQWEPEELFYIVKHGVKFTGMPAWPALERDDEVWAMTAFLQKLPELDAEEYRRLVDGDGASAAGAPLERLTGTENVPRQVVETCARCHGVDGLGRGIGAFPRLRGQQSTYLELALRAFASGQRNSGIMEPIAAELNDDEIRALARYYGGLERAEHEPVEADDRETMARGEEIAQHGVPAQRVPACVACHGPGDIERNAAYPTLAGQYAEYLVLQLELFKAEHRGGSAYAHLMHPVASRLTPEQMRDVAAYYRALPPANDSER